MNKYKKAFKLIILVFLIFLASFGIGLSGGIPIPTSTKRNRSAEVKNELLDSQNEDSQLKKGSIKS